jgi:hypothetical protein
MAAGIQPTQAQINLQAGQIILASRNSLQAILFFDQYLNSIGHAGLMALGFADADATELLSVYSNMSSVVNMCFGQPYVGPTLPFNFLAQTVPLWGGQ